MSPNAARSDEDAQILRAFRSVANMTPSRLERWLDSDKSRSVGQRRGSGESVGHASGRRIIAIKRTPKADLTRRDYAHMRKVVGYVRRHLAQRPEGDVRETPWRYSLMNWGHDPLKG
jgi:hypothetical protein